jgi:AcrR family transcriptional regulator
MELTETTTAPTATHWHAAFLDHVLTHGKPPISVYAFAKAAGADETAFYEVYNNFTALEQAIWVAFFDQTQARLAAEPAYANYSVREKQLAFLFTWVEVLKPMRSYVLYAAELNKKMPLIPPAELATLKTKFIAFANDLVNQGLDSGELAARPLLTERYAEAFWVQLLFITQFWVKDTSAGFEQTDAAIEKGVRLGFELMGNNVLDAATDLAKFLWQNRR